MKNLLLFVAFATLIGGQGRWAHCQATTADTSTGALEDSNLTEDTVYIPLKADGSVDSADLFDSMSGELHWIAGSVTAFTRSFGIQNRGFNTIPKDRIDAMMGDYPGAFSYTRHPQTGIDCLAVDQEALGKLLADKKSGIRKWLASSQGKTIANLTKVESTWTDAERNPRRIVVVMAGLHGVESQAETMAEAIHETSNLPTAVFAYANDAPIDESAGLLVMHLQDFHQQYPKSKITLVTHSMGGLVSRGAIELQGGAGNARSSVTARTGIDQLIQVFPPNHGSALAEYGPVLEGAEKAYRLLNRDRSRDSRVLFSSIVDGFNEATTDLQPNSRFLKRLNACERNPNVRYTVIVGSGGPLKLRFAGLLGSVWNQISANVDEPAQLDRRIRSILTSEELQSGKGDGVVSIDSAMLEGVDDVVVLPAHHLSWNQLDTDEGQNILSEVTQRLAVAL